MRSPYTPYSIYLRGATGFEVQGLGLRFQGSSPAPNGACSFPDFAAILEKGQASQRQSYKGVAEPSTEGLGFRVFGLRVWGLGFRKVFFPGYGEFYMGYVTPCCSGLLS